LVNNGDGARLAAQLGVLPGTHAVWLIATGLRVARILGDAEYLDENSVIPENRRADE
jgi:hypothetical protein